MRLVMMGTGSFAEPTFARLLDGPQQVVGLFTQPDRPTGKERGSTRQARQGMKDLALVHGIPVFQPESINTPDGVRDLSELTPELLVVAAYGQILNNDVLGAARLGGINVHASLLPKYRGAAPINWAIDRGETQTGVSIIRMSLSLDAGDILAQAALDIGPDETTGELETRLGPLGATLAVDVVNRLEQGPVAGTKQDQTLVTKAPKLTKDHGLIDWTRPAAGVCNQVRAMQPWPTPYTFLHRPGHEPLRLIVPRARIAPEPAGEGPVRAAAGGLFARAGDGAWVEIVEVQPAGKRRMAAGEFLRGHPVDGKTRLGPA